MAGLGLCESLVLVIFFSFFRQLVPFRIFKISYYCHELKVRQVKSGLTNVKGLEYQSNFQVFPQIFDCATDFSCPIIWPLSPIRVRPFVCIFMFVHLSSFPRGSFRRSFDDYDDDGGEICDVAAALPPLLSIL